MSVQAPGGSQSQWKVRSRASWRLREGQTHDKPSFVPELSSSLPNSPRRRQQERLSSRGRASRWAFRADTNAVTDLSPESIVLVALYREAPYSCRRGTTACQAAAGLAGSVPHLMHIKGGGALPADERAGCIIATARLAFSSYVFHRRGVPTSRVRHGLKRAASRV